MSAGYWRNDEEARAKFIHTGGDDVPVYLTGDMGELAADGCLTHLGRKDFQIKVRGFRIEIAEVEHTLARVPGVADCACWIAKNRRGEEQLVGYIVPKLPEQFSQSEAAKFLQAQLPDYMVPRIYITLEALPYLPSGKVDRKALPSPFEHADGQEDANPQGIPLVLHKVQEIFQEILKLDRVSEATDFLSEGGDSLSVAILKHQLDVNFGVEIAMDELSDSVTPAGVAILIASAQGRAPRSSMKWADGASTQPAQISRSLLLTGDGPAPTTVEATEVRNSVSRRSASAGTKDLVIISAGRLGREIVTWATHAIAAGANYRIKGFLDDRADALAGFQYDTSILGSVESYEIRERDVFVGAIGDPRAKLAYYALILEKGGQFINVIHPSAIVGSHVRLGSGIVLAPYTVLTADVSIGDHVAIGTFSNIGHDVMIGSWCQISSHCGVNGMATLGKGVFLGSHACVIPAKKVGDWAFIGAGSVVVRDVEPGAKVFGNPAAVIGKA
jgi:sugar O-acyltransferase (sialic acid O-acetyltransferase NeuD family)